jgi:hypothetical protein
MKSLSDTGDISITLRNSIRSLTKVPQRTDRARYARQRIRKASEEKPGCAPADRTV